jgi:phytoene/squalene synthetase
MKTLFDQLSQDCSQKVTTTYSTSFSMAVKMLSPKIQGDIHSIYGFVRLADEIVDTFHEYEKKTLLDEFERDTFLAIERKISLNPILNSFQEVVHKYNIDDELTKAFMASMRADLEKTTYSSFEDYETYIYGSADVVGLMCLKVFVSGDQAMYDNLKAPAMRLGSAFQKVNFLRDLKDDTEGLSRTYFPHLVNAEFNAETKEQIINEINDDFEAAYIGIKQLPIEAKFGVYTAYIYYLKLLKKLKRTNAEKISETRIRVSDPLKMFLLARSFVNYKLNLI